jgi:hypothetical protein
MWDMSKDEMGFFTFFLTARYVGMALTLGHKLETM